MAYIGKLPTVGNFQVCDAISVVNGQAAYTMQVGSVNVSPETAQNCLVSLNGVLQAPISSYTVSGSTITFASALVTGDVIDFIQILGDVLNIGTPSDSTVSLAKLSATGTKDATTFLRGDNTFASASGGLQSIQSFSSSATYTKPSGINKIKVYITGAGGSGSYGGGSNYAGGGGAAGGTAIKIIDATSITTVAVTIASATSNNTGAAGSTGGSSSFGSYCSATGGQGGNKGGSINGTQQAGIGSGGDLNLRGGAGWCGEDSNNAIGGRNGGDSYWGGSGNGTYYDSAQAGINGGGGAGGFASYQGADGGAGFCVVEEYK